MKRTIFSICLIIFSLSASMALASNPDPETTPDNPIAPAKTENKLSEEEIASLTKRVEEIRDMDKTELTAKERRDLRKELRAIKEDVRRQGGYVYVGGGTLLVVLILVLLLL
jgi:hypothetical protein